jgi:hypothetical protein
MKSKVQINIKEDMGLRKWRAWCGRRYRELLHILQREVPKWQQLTKASV